MPIQTGDDIADIRALLQDCCSQLASLADAELLRSLEGEVPPAASSLDLPGPPGGGTASVEDILAGTAGPRWRPLLVGLPPGVEAMLDTVKPPLTAIVAILKLLATFLEILKVLLIGIPDPFYALILAAYKALQALINDLLNTGAYLYYDAPGFTSKEVSLAELGLAVEARSLFDAGQNAEAAPPFPLDGFERWAGRFAASFDDPGDAARPILSTGASVESVFIVGAAPTLEALAQLVWLLGNLLNLDAFKRAFDRFVAGSPDPGRSRVDQQSVAPDWHSTKLADLLPPLKSLQQVPEILMGLMAKLQSVMDLLADLANAVGQKVQVLLALADMIQKVIDLLDALKAAGLYILPVATNEGVAGLKKAFVEAKNRPEGGYLCGVCLLAAGPGLKDAAILWEILAGGALAKAGEEAGKLSVEAYEKQKDAAEAFGKSARDAYNDMVDAVESLPEKTLESLGQTAEDLRDGLLNAPADIYEVLADAKQELLDDALREGTERARQAQRHGDRSLAMYLGGQLPTSAQERVNPADLPTAAPGTGPEPEDEA